MQEGDRVEYVGDDNAELFLWRGHPGLLYHCNTVPSVNIVGFVNGPSLDFSSTSELRVLSFDEYVRRGRRLVDGLHPLDDRQVTPLMARGHEWSEGKEPQSPDEGWGYAG